MKYVPKFLRPAAQRLAAAVASPTRRMTAAAVTLAGFTVTTGGPAYALDLFGQKAPERVKSGAGVRQLAETDPAAAAYNAGLNGWSDWSILIIFGLLAGLVLFLAKKNSDRGEGRGSIGGFIIAIVGVALLGGIAA